MNLAIDIGNTNITVGLFKNSKLIKKMALATKSPDYYPFFRKLSREHKLDKAIVASVVPKATKKIEQALRKLKTIKVLILGKNLIVPIKNRYQFPEQVGQDRLVNGFAAAEFYGCPAVIVDFGTAITFDVISEKKEYLGGMILPGMETSLKALNEKTALLPGIKLSAAPKDLIGRNTRDSMLSGVIFGFSCLTDGMLAKLKSRLGKNCKTIGTGGNINFISRFCKGFSAIDINLTLKGLDRILTCQI